MCGLPRNLMAFLACLLSQAAVLLSPAGLCAMPCCVERPVAAEPAEERPCCAQKKHPAPERRHTQCCGQCRPLVSTSTAPLVGIAHTGPLWLFSPAAVVVPGILPQTFSSSLRATAPPWDPLRSLRTVRLLV